jgi:hypothetical protein
MEHDRDTQGRSRNARPETNSTASCRTARKAFAWPEGLVRTVEQTLDDAQR